MDSTPNYSKKRNYAQAHQFLGTFSDKKSFYAYMSEQL